MNYLRRVRVSIIVDMEQIVSTAINELKDELTETVDATKEPSRLVRIIHLKYKCFVVFFLSCIAVLLVMYISLKEVLQDDDATFVVNKVFELLSKKYFPNDTISIPNYEKRNS